MLSVEHFALKPLASHSLQQGTKQRNYRQLEAAESKRLPTKFAKAVAIRRSLFLVEQF
jgi:hypothetical protein